MSLFEKLREFVKRKVVMYNKGEISLKELKEYLPEYYRISLDESGYVDFIFDTTENGEFNIEIYNLYKNFDEYMEKLKCTARNYNEGKITIDEFLLSFSENDEGFSGNFVYAGKKVIKVIGDLYEYFTDGRLV